VNSFRGGTVELNRSYKEGFEDGWANLTDPKRFTDPEYLEGAIAGALYWDRFIASTKDHGPKLAPSLTQEQPKMMQLERLKEEELVSAPSAIWPFNSFFDEQPNVKGIEFRHTALC
jgi:hypothetical protein